MSLTPFVATSDAAGVSADSSGRRARDPASTTTATAARIQRQRRNPAVAEIVKIPNRGHALTIDHGWREVAQIALDFVKRFA
jgi:pimeloyl-ACP methyl ester carboxylesterase